MSSPNPTLVAFGKRLRAFRHARGWTQEDLARSTDRHWTYIGGLERGERNPTLVVLDELAAALRISPADLLAKQHGLCAKLNAPPSDILDAIDKGFRAQIDVKGKLAELYMSRQLEDLRRRGAIESFVWQDVDGKPDFIVRCEGREVVIECKNIRNEIYTRDPSFKVELQRTRNSMDGTPTRGYKVDEIDVLGVSLFNQTNRWEYLYMAVKHLKRRARMPDFLVVMQRVPMQPSQNWSDDPLDAIRDAIGASE